jgi:hypothetical protein
MAKHKSKTEKRVQDIKDAIDAEHSAGKDRRAQLTAEITRYTGKDEERLRKLCLRLNVPFDDHPIIRLAFVGALLARQQAEFRRGKGRPRGMEYRPDDEKLLDVIESVMKEHNWDFKAVLRSAIRLAKLRGKLNSATVGADRKRLAQKWEARQLKHENSPTLASVLMNGWEK